MGQAMGLDVYEVVSTDGRWSVIRRADGKTAKVPAGWLDAEGGTARAVSQTKQVRIEGEIWE